MVAQQLLVLPYHPTKPTPLPFQTTHLFLVGTRSIVQDVGIGYTAAPPNKPRTVAEKKAIARKMIAMAFDPSWLEANESRFNLIFENVLRGVTYVF